MSTKTSTSIRLTRTLRAPREKVFRAWTQPERMKEWSAPEGFTVAEVESDLRVGGRFRIAMVDPEGGGHTAVGEYREIDAPRRLVYTWDWAEEGAEMGDTLVTVEFREAGENETEVTLIHDLFPNKEAGENHEQGWTSCLNRLEKLVA